MKIKIGIADDHLLIINGVVAMLEKFEDIVVVFTAADGISLAEALVQQQPDILLLDIQMPGSSGIELSKVISKEYPEVKIIALTNFGESYYVKQMLRSGAAGYLLKNTDQNTLRAAIEAVLKGEQFLHPQIRQLLLDESITGKKKSLVDIMLTKREEEILALVAREYTNQEIADKLFISLRTVQTHRLNLTQKLNAKNTAGLVNEAYKRGLI